MENYNNILNIRFNAGHSTLLFLLASKDSIIYCLDTCEHKYTKKCFDYLNSMFSNRLKLIKGNSIGTLTLFFDKNFKFDIIHCDGSKQFNTINSSFYHTKNLIIPNKTILIFNNTHLDYIKFLWDGYIRDKHIKEINNILEVKEYKHTIGFYL